MQNKATSPVGNWWLTRQERKVKLKDPVSCPKCETVVESASLERHIDSEACKETCRELVFDRSGLVKVGAISKHMRALLEAAEEKELHLAKHKYYVERWVFLLAIS